MKNTGKFVALLLALIIATPVMAASPTNTFANCLVDSLNGKERKNLAKWIFFSMAAHPDIQAYANVTPKDVQENDAYIGHLVTRLLADDCPAQLKQANAADPQAVKKAFELVGQVAMQELMSNQNVARSITNYARYADIQKIQQALASK